MRAKKKPNPRATQRPFSHWSVDGRPNRGRRIAERRGPMTEPHETPVPALSRCWLWQFLTALREALAAVAF
jgi:hypothetical protein